MLINYCSIFLFAEKVTFTDCTQLPLTVGTENDVFVYNADSGFTLPDDGLSCTSIRVQAKRAGHTVVKASYSHGKVNLKASVTIAAFNPLVVSLDVILEYFHYYIVSGECF